MYGNLSAWLADCHGSPDQTGVGLVGRALQHISSDDIVFFVLFECDLQPSLPVWVSCHYKLILCYAAEYVAW